MLLQSHLPFSISYLTFSLIYYAAGGQDEKGNPYVYSKLDWGNQAGMSVAYSFGALLLTLIMHCIAYGLYRLRLDQL